MNFGLRYLTCQNSTLTRHCTEDSGRLESGSVDIEPYVLAHRQCLYNIKFRFTGAKPDSFENLESTKGREENFDRV